MTRAKYNLLLGASLDSENRGVNALGIGAITYLKSIFPYHQIRIVQVSGREEVTTKTVDVNSRATAVEIYHIPGKKLLWVAFLSFWSKALGLGRAGGLFEIFSGAENIFDLNEGDSFSDIYGLKRFLRHFTDSYLSILAGKPLILLPQTIGPFRTFLGKTFAKVILCRASRIYSRDSNPNQFLVKNSIDYQQADDLACIMVPKVVQAKIPERYIGINVSGFLYFRSYGVALKGFEEYKALLSMIIRHFRERDHTLLLIPHTYNVYMPNREDDLSAMRDLMKDKDDPRIAIIDKEYDTQELKFIIGRSDFFIGSRMHACIAALTQNVPTVGLSYSAKFEGTFERFAQRDRVISVLNLSREQIAETIAEISRIFDDRHRIKSALQELNAKRETFKWDRGIL